MDAEKDDSLKQLSLSVIKNAIENHKPSSLNDIKLQNEFSRKSSVVNLGLTAVMCVPLISQESVMGAVYIDRRNKEEKFTEEDLFFFWFHLQSKLQRESNYHLK